MKVLTRRRGNTGRESNGFSHRPTSMKVPARRQGNDASFNGDRNGDPPSMKVPTRRRGNYACTGRRPRYPHASMKVPTRKRGNLPPTQLLHRQLAHLNESPRPKAEKFGHLTCETLDIMASMKVPTCRWRNLVETDKASKGHYPHLYYQSAIELVIPPLPCRASIANEHRAARE